MKKIDAVGINCPKPVIMTKKEFDQMDEGIVQVLADNKPCVMNLKKYAESNGFDYENEQIEEDRWEVTITKKKGSHISDSEIPDDMIIEDNNGSFVVAIGTKYYGTGLKAEDNEDFGKSLMESFIYTLSESEPYPDQVIFFNSGIFLTIEGSPVLEDLKKMEEKGVEIHSCGACLDYYEKTDELKVGEISNMYVIYESLRDTGRNMIIA